MNPDADVEIRQLLVEIRDDTREHLALYREVAERSLAMQSDAVQVQRRSVALYRVVVLVVFALIAFAAGALAFLFQS